MILFTVSSITYDDSNVPLHFDSNLYGRSYFNSTFDSASSSSSLIDKESQDDVN